MSTSPGRLVAADLDLGADAYEAGDYATAIREWQPLADEGNPMALYNFAVLYELGLGVNADRNQAADLYARAAEQGLADAQYEIGNLHMNGFYGSRDRDEAIAWSQSATGQGHSDAIDKLSARGVFDRQQLSPVRSVAKKKGSIMAKNGNAKKSGLQKIEVKLEESRSGRCPKVSNLDYEVNGIDAVMVYRSMTIYVASDYKKGSCEYRQISEHEKQHVENAA